MTNTGQIVAAFRDIAATKSLNPDEVNELIRDGIIAGLVKIYGPNVQAEIEIDEGSGDIEIIVLKRVVEAVEDPLPRNGLSRENLPPRWTATLESAGTARPRGLPGGATCHGEIGITAVAHARGAALVGHDKYDKLTRRLRE